MKDKKQLSSEQISDPPKITSKQLTEEISVAAEKCLRNDFLKLDLMEINEPSCFMDFERDYKRLKSNSNAFYHYMKVIFGVLIARI